MKIICFGAGAIGSYIGGSLQSAGHDVTFIERKESLPRIRSNGIQIEDVKGNIHKIESPHVTDDAIEAVKECQFDAAVIAVKSFDTERLMKSLIEVIGLLPPFISLQNGVENEALLASYLGKAKVVPASVCTAISRKRDGLIKVEKLRGIGITAGHFLSEDIYKAFRSANLKPALIADGTAMKWSKMISNLLANASSAILDMTPAEIFSDPDGFRLEIQQIREAVRVMDAYTIPVINIPGIPVKTLVWAVQNLPEKLLRPVLINAVGGGRGEKMPSFYIDLHSGQPQNEVEYLNGAVVRFAREKAIHVPVNSGYYRILTALVKKELPLETYRHQPRKLAQDIFANE